MGRRGACPLVVGRGSFARRSGRWQWVRNGYAAVFTTASDDQQSQRSDLRFITQSTQLEAVNAQIVSFASSRSGVRIPLAPQENYQVKAYSDLIGVQRHRRLGVSQHPLQRFHVGTRRHRQDAAVCRRSCGVIVGNVSSACWHRRTASSSTRARQLELRSTPPRASANTSSSRALPTIDAGMSSASPAGNGTDRATSVQLSSQASSGMEYADAARRCFSQLTKCPVCGRATFCGPHSRSPV
jgi:hypothetical protein